MKTICWQKPFGILFHKKYLNHQNQKLADCPVYTYEEFAVLGFGV